ncbi:DUF6668 family protein [Kineococcus xinjiangensis]|uniref:DUF6668 family protein n=1 Tax=Kineococcus xinjiangensis TaxID=512762 RepID=UPI0011B0A5ED|nr:DUF6668 family protein [Kineococcus xinjiangensis]
MAPPRPDRLPRRPVAWGPALWVVGAHGGSAESTLAGLLPGAAAAGHAWPQPPGGPDVPVLLVARSDARGLRAAQHAATEWAAGVVAGVELLGLAVVADAPGKPPRPLRQFAALVAGGVPRLWHLPWVDAWRIGEQPVLAAAPGEFRRLAADLRSLVPPTAAARGPY